MATHGPTFNPSSYSDVPLYNIQAVAAATGVPAITLRSWERRYSVPEPKRDAKGYRLYSERDIAVTRWLKERVQQGVGISRAVNMLSVLEQEDPVLQVEKTFDFTSLQQRLLDAIGRLDEVGVNRVVAEALMVASVEMVALQLLQPVLYRVGDLWAGGQLSVTTEHVGSNLLRAHLAQLVRISPAPIRNERVLLGCAPGELHDMGILMLALFLRRRGFDVIYAGASVEPDDFVADVLRLQPNAVCLSAGSPRHARALATLYEELRARYDGLIGFGGRAFNEHNGLAETTPGCYLGPDADSGVRRLEQELSGVAAPVSPAATLG